MLFLDTEFNGFKGELISMGLVSDTNTSQWYECVWPNEPIDPWVKDHVIPYMNKQAISKKDFKESLHSFIKQHIDMTVRKPLIIVADWPEDFIHLLRLSCDKEGQMWDLEFDCRLIVSGPLDPTIPHNALSDATALMKWYQSNRLTG